VRIDVRDDTSAFLVYGSGWRRSTASSAYRGGVHTTRRAGSEVSTTFTGRGFAVVGTAGPSLGAIQVFVDGRFAGTFSEARPPAGASRIGLSRRFSAPGPHTIRLVAHDARRIDLDAIILLR
jgi:hypothetical protein